MYNNILIVKLSAIGDVIHSLPVTYALKQCFPMARITWIVEKPAYDLLKNNPYLDDIIIFEKSKFKSLSGLLKNGYALSQQLKQQKFDLVLDLQGLFKSAAIAYLSGGKRRLVYCNAKELSYLVSFRVCGDHVNGHITERYLDVVRSLGCSVNHVAFPLEITEDEAIQAINIARNSGLDITKKYVVLAPGTNWPNKCWATINFANLADMLCDIGIIPVIVGGSSDCRLSKEILDCMKQQPIDLIGKTTLKQLAFIIRKSRLFIGGDTGPMHLAVAVGKKVIALFGPTDPQRNGPYGDGHTTLVSPQDCTGCWQRNCPKGIDCLSKISPIDVFNIAKQYLI